MPLRRKPPKGNVRNVHSNGKTTTGTTVNNEEDIVQFESGAEDILQMLFLRDKTIKRLVSQPIVISFYDLEGKLHKYTPDYLVERFDGSIEIHELTMSGRMNKPEIIRRHRAAKAYCEERGWKYFIHTEQDLLSLTGRDNLQALFGFCARAYNNEAVQREIFQFLKEREKVRHQALFDYISASLGMEARIINGTIFHQLWLGNLCTDFDTLMFIEGIPNPKMQIWLTKG